MADVLVVGGNGFLGAHLVDALVLDGHSVTVFDRFSTEPSYKSSEVRAVVGDFLSRTDIDAAVGGQQVVFHLLSTTTPMSADDDPALDVRTNLEQTIELLEASANAEIDHFFFASSGGAIYGDQGRDVYHEEVCPQPFSPYAIGKLTIEHFLRYFRMRYGFTSTALRISNPYGPGQRSSHRQGLIPIALREAAQGNPVIRFGDGSMVRDYLFVGDLVEMIRPMVGVKPRYDIYNLGSGIGHSVNQILEAVSRVSGLKLNIVERPRPTTFVEKVILDTSRYRAEFGEFPLTALDEGVLRTWEAMRDEH